MKIVNMGRNYLFLSLFVLATTNLSVDGLKSEKLCWQCTKCETSKCPASDAYPHMTAFDDTLIAGALQSDYVNATDRGVYSVQDVKGGTSTKFNAYFGWQSTSGSASGYHRFSNYMDKCSGGQSYLTVDKHGTVRLRPFPALRLSIPLP